MKNVVTQFNQTGVCPINIEAVINQWNNRCSISRWQDTYKLIELVWRNGGTKGGTNIKVAISESDAKILIVRLNLNMEQSFLASGKTYRTARTEAESVIIEQMAYIKQANKKIRDLNKLLKVKS